MQQTQALEEALLYFAGALDDGRLDARLLDGDMLRGLVAATRRMSEDVSIGDVWTVTHDIIGAAWIAAHAEREKR